MRFCGHCGTPRPTEDSTTRESPAAPRPISITPGQLGDAEFDTLRSFVTGQLADRLIESGGELTEERRLVTALFADLSGFTPLSERLDSEELLEVIDPIIRSGSGPTQASPLLLAGTLLERHRCSVQVATLARARLRRYWPVHTSFDGPGCAEADLTPSDGPTPASRLISDCRQNDSVSVLHLTEPHCTGDDNDDQSRPRGPQQRRPSDARIFIGPVPTINAIATDRRSRPRRSTQPPRGDTHD